MSLFLRAYHFRNNREHIFKDEYAQELLSKEEYETISENLSSGVSFFAPGFTGTKQEALRLIADRKLAPPVLIRSAFLEKMLDNDIRFGLQYYISFASGYDTYTLRTEHLSLKAFELDLPPVIDDKLARIQRAGLESKCETTYIRCDLATDKVSDLLLKNGFDHRKRSFGSLLGFSYYLDKSDFRKLIGEIAALWCEGSSVLFDYPMTEGGQESERTRALAAGANEKMKAEYTYREIESLLADCGFLIYEHHDDKSATKAFCESYNRKNPQHEITAPKGVGYVLAVKKR